jgi:hypothetical protein
MSWPVYEVSSRTAQRHKAVVMINPIQDPEIGIVIGPTTKAQLFKARTRWITATRPKIRAETTRYAWLVLCNMVPSPFLNSKPENLSKIAELPAEIPGSQRITSSID